jgi:hypothetical protein
MNRLKTEGDEIKLNSKEHQMKFSRLTNISQTFG